MQLIQELIFNYHINLEIHEVEHGIIVNEKDFQIQASQMSHGTPTLAYSLILKDKIRLNKSKLSNLSLLSYISLNLVFIISALKDFFVRFYYELP